MRSWSGQTEVTAGAQEEKECRSHALSSQPLLVAGLRGRAGVLQRRARALEGDVE